MFTTITDAYRYYTELFGSETPVWTLDELRSHIHSLGKRYEELTEDDIQAAYDESIESATDDEAE